MDIRSKSIRYSTGLKAAAIVISWLCFLSAISSGIFILYNENSFKDSYYETKLFKTEFAGLSRDAVELHILLKNEENIKASKATADDIADKLNRMVFIKDELSSMVNYVYYVRNTQTGEVFTNVKNIDPIAFVKKQAHATSLSRWEAYDPYLEETRSMIAGSSFEAYAAVVEPLKQGDVFYNGFYEYQRMKTNLDNSILLLIASLILLTVCASYLICVAGRKEKDGEIHLTVVDRIYVDLHTLLVAFAAIVSFMVVMNGFSLGEYLSWAVFLIIASIDAFIGMSYVLSMTRQIKNGTLFKNSLIHKVYDSLKELAKLGFGGRLFKAWVLLLLFGYGIINGLLFTVGTHINRDYQIPIVFGVFLAFNIAVIYFSAKALMSLSQIMEGVREISRGNMEYGFNTADMSAAFAGFAEDIQSIQGGLKKAVAEAVKGERMKTDLITNVSHDLKTPLTSIINYIDLLKKESLNNDSANEYISILEEKSARLKQLVEDLIEASKASSGNLSVNAGMVDLHELVMQACGEYEEQISKSALDLRINAEEKNIIVFADGKHMWRIVENLLLNALKYSMSNSRVYVNISKNATCGILTIKNISAYPLDVSPEQLTERFIRGDASRTTEGSGLGLAISKSLVELQSGKLSVAIDGDLFKATVEMPLWEEK